MLLNEFCKKSNEDQEKKKNAKRYFRLATKFNSNYKRYEKLLDNETTDNDLEDKVEDINYYHLGLIAFQYEKYHEAKEAFVKHLKANTITPFEQIESHKYLSKIYEYEEDYISAIEHSTEVLDKYADENILEKVETCYRLSQLYTKGEQDGALEYIEKGLNFIGNRDDKIFLDLKYKLQVKRNGLREDDETKTINSTLVELVKLNPEKYVDEFLQEYFKRVGSEITNYDIYTKIEELQKDVRGIKFDEKKR